VLKDEYVETLMGRRRYFHGLSVQANQQIKNRQLREAINAPIQGTAADILNTAMIQIAPALKKAGMKGKMLLQVHDELVLECPKDEVDATAKLVKEKMAGAFTLKVPLKTDARAGVNWGKMKPVEV
jgi:DNA polymerase-1